MASIAEEAMLFSLGAAALARDRLRGLIDESVTRGRLSREVGEELLEGFARRATTEGEDVRSRVGSGLHGLARELGVITRPELQEIELKVAQLEHRVALLEKQLESALADPAAGPAS